LNIAALGKIVPKKGDISFYHSHAVGKMQQKKDLDRVSQRRRRPPLLRPRHAIQGREWTTLQQALPA
jgi:hypothetical protein